MEWLELDGTLEMMEAKRKSNLMIPRSLSLGQRSRTFILSSDYSSGLQYPGVLPVISVCAEL